MKLRTDFHSVNLSTGEKTRSIVGDGQRVDEKVPAPPQPAQSDALTATALNLLNQPPIFEVEIFFHDIPEQGANRATVKVLPPAPTQLRTEEKSR